MKKYFKGLHIRFTNGHGINWLQGVHVYPKTCFLAQQTYPIGQFIIVMMSGIQRLISRINLDINIENQAPSRKSYEVIGYYWIYISGFSDMIGRCN